MIKIICYIFCFLFFVNCKSELKTNSGEIKNVFVSNKTETFHDSLINIIEKKLIGEKITENEKIEHLKIIYKKSLERDMEKPYMWDVFVSSNDTLLNFYRYEKEFVLNKTKFKPYYIKIDYEDASYESLMLINENSTNLFKSIIVYENLKAEENYTRTTKLIAKNKLIINFNIGNLENREQIFQIKDGLFLDYFDQEKVDKKWGNNNEYELKGETKNNLKNGYWIEKRYSFEYGKNIIEDGNYINGSKDGEWNYSPEGPVDKIQVFKNGVFINTFYP